MPNKTFRMDSQSPLERTTNKGLAPNDVYGLTESVYSLSIASICKDWGNNAWRGIAYKLCELGD